MSDLLLELEAQIEGARTIAARQNLGVIREIGDGVARWRVLPTRCSMRCSIWATALPASR